MKQPVGFVHSQSPSHICKFRQSLYGLKQAPYACYTTLNSYLNRLGFSHSNANPSLFIYHKDSIQTYLLVYVDGLILTNSSSLFDQ